MSGTVPDTGSKTSLPTLNPIRAADIRYDKTARNILVIIYLAAAIYSLN